MQKINIKKVTKEQMLAMLEEAQDKQEAAEAEAAAHFKDGVKLAEENEKLRGQIGGMGTREQQLRAKNAALTEQIDQMNGEAINKANEIANLKADADVLRNKLAESEEELSKHRAATVKRLDELKKQLADTEAVLERANAEVSRLTHDLTVAKNVGVQYASAFKYAVEHPFETLWEWMKRKLGWKA